MAMNLNRVKITPVDGLVAYMPNVPEPHNCIVSASQSTALVAGDIVTIDTSATNPNCPVIKKAGVTDVIFGVIPFDSYKDKFAAGEKVSVAVEGSYIYKTAAGAIAQGATLYFNTSMQVTSTATPGNSTLGTANTYAAAANDLVQVKLKFGTTVAEG